jgi:hypothetical protein
VTRVTVPMIRRMGQLHEAGLSYPDVARVISLDWKRTVSADQVRYYIGRGRPLERTPVGRR